MLYLIPVTIAIILVSVVAKNRTQNKPRRMYRHQRQNQPPAPAPKANTEPWTKKVNDGIEKNVKPLAVVIGFTAIMIATGLIFPKLLDWAFVKNPTLGTSLVLLLVAYVLPRWGKNAEANEKLVGKGIILTAVAITGFFLYQDFGKTAIETVNTKRTVQLPHIAPPEGARMQVIVPATGLSQKILIPYYTDVTASWLAEDTVWIWTDTGNGTGKWLQFRSKTGKEVKGEITW